MAPKLPEGALKRKDMHLIDPAKVNIREGWNPRKDFNTPDDFEFCRFIIDNGPQFPPVIIKRNADGAMDLVDGERRVRASLGAIAAGAQIEGIPAILIDANTNEIEQLSLSITSNAGKPLKPLEEAEACKRLKSWGMDDPAIAKRIGKSLSHVRNRLALAQSSPAVAAAVEQGTITQGEAMAAVKEAAGDIQKQDEKLERIRKPTAQKAPKMMSRLVVQKKLEDLVKRGQSNAIDFDKLDKVSLGLGAMIGLMMTLKNMSEDDAKSEVWLMMLGDTAQPTEAPPWERE